MQTIVLKKPPKQAAAQQRARTQYAKRITRSVAEIIVERHARVRSDSRPPIRLASETICDLDDDIGFTVQTVDAGGDFVSHHVVIDRDGHVRRIVTPD